jgi:serine/threonine-protein kinase
MENTVVNNRYRVLRRIGAGGFGFTYLGEDLGFPHRPKCVIKQLRPQSDDPATLALAGELFVQEAETLRRLGRHPSIPGLIAHFRDRGEFFLVQEFVEGHTLEQEFTGGKQYDQHETIQLLGQLLEVLSFVHGERVVHRDVKPANIIRRASDASLVLIDFGAVKQLNADGGGNSAAIGSHGYMPVEQLAGNPCFSSDLFALGLVAIQGLSGVKPFEIPKDPETLEFIWSPRAALLPEMRAFISTLVRRNARDRYVSAREALSALNAVAAGAGFFNGQRTATVARDVPLAESPEIPATVIVSPQHRLIRPSAPAAAETGSGEGNRGLFRIALGFGAFVLLMLVFHFAGVGSRPEIRGAKPNRSAPEERSSAAPVSPPIDVFEEARKQADEAAAKEKTASTKFEWEEIANKYRRAYLLFSSVSESHPMYPEARKNVDHYRKESERARDRSQNGAAD